MHRSILLAVLLLAAPALAQDEEAEAPPAPKPSPRASKKPKAAKPADKTPKKKTSASKAAKAHVLKSDELKGLDAALDVLLKEQKVQPLVLEEPADDDALVAAMQTLDTSLDAQLKKSQKAPLAEMVENTATGLATIVDDLANTKPKVPDATASATEETPAPEGSPIAVVPRDPDTAPETVPATAPPPPTIEAPRVIAIASPAPASKSVRYVLSRVVVSKDGGPEADVPVPTGGPVRPVPLALRSGIPAVELKLVVKLPDAIDLGESTQLAAQANVVAPGAVAELMLLDELVDSVRATPEAGAVTAAGTVSYSFVKRVGGVYSYQQTFAQGDGRSTPTLPSRTLLLNWSDREPAIELPFSWTATAPSAASLKGRAIHTPASRP